MREQVTDATERRHFWERVVTGVVAEHAFAGRDADAERALEAALASWGSDDVARRGEAYLVGAGPGGIDLITIRGRQLLATADVVLYDRLASAELLQYARRDAELICVGKTPRRPSISQKQLNRLLVSLVQARASASAASRAAIRSSSAAAARSSKRSPRQGSSSRSCPASRRPKAARRTPAFR